MKVTRAQLEAGTAQLLKQQQHGVAPSRDYVRQVCDAVERELGQCSRDRHSVSSPAEVARIVEFITDYRELDTARARLMQTPSRPDGQTP